MTVLEKLHERPEDPDHTAAHFEFLQIQRQIELERTQNLGLFSLLKKPSYRKRLLCGFFVQCMGQSSGVLVIANYQVSLYANLGVTGSLPLLLLSLYNGWAAILNGLNSLIIDRVGRIRIMTIGMVRVLARSRLSLQMLMGH